MLSSACPAAAAATSAAVALSSRDDNARASKGLDPHNKRLARYQPDDMDLAAEEAAEAARLASLLPQLQDAAQREGGGGGGRGRRGGRAGAAAAGGDDDEVSVVVFFSEPGCGVGGRGSGVLCGWKKGLWAITVGASSIWFGLQRHPADIPVAFPPSLYVLALYLSPPPKTTPTSTNKITGRRPAPAAPWRPPHVQPRRHERIRGHDACQCG